jgi:hypothetical protein
MEKVKIMNARIEQISGGPDIPIFVGEVELKPKSGESFFFSISECEGMPAVFKTDHSVLDVLMGEEDDAFEKLQDNLLYEGENYDGLLEIGDKIECFDGVLYLVYLMRASWEDVDKFIKKTVGKDLAKVKVPEIDVEEEIEEL